MRKIIDARTSGDFTLYRNESALQIAVVANAMGLARRFPEVRLLHSIPNGDWRGPRVAQKLKAEGVLPGMPDLCLPVPRGGYHGMYLELKHGRGLVRPSQWSIMLELHAHGYFVRLTNHMQTALELLEGYLSDEYNRYDDQ
jgi:hypothetical protein